MIKKLLKSPPLEIILLVLIAVINTAIIVQAVMPAQADDLPVVRYMQFKVYDPVYVAIDQGFFEQRGVKVELVGDVLAGPTAIQAVASGRADAGLSSIPALINANAAGLPVIGVSDIQSALPGQPLEYFFVRSDSDIHDISDLPGHTFAVNLWKSSFHYTALMALEQHEVAEDSVNFVLLPFNNQAEALVTGNVDVIGLMEPYASAAKAVYGDDIRLLFDASDVFGEKQFTLHFLNRLWAEYNPDTASAFVGGIADAIAWIKEHPDEAREIISKYTGIEAKYVPDYHFQEHGSVLIRDVQFWMEYLTKRGDLEVDWLNVGDVATNAYNPYLIP